MRLRGRNRLYGHRRVATGRALNVRPSVTNPAGAAVTLTGIASAGVTEKPVSPAFRSAIVPVTPGKSREVREIDPASKIAAGGDRESSSEKLNFEPIACKTWPTFRSKLPAENVRV